MRKWDGQRPRVLAPIEGDSSCHVRNGEADGLSSFPALEAQRAGPWTMIVKKRSGPPVTAQLEVTFNRDGRRTLVGMRPDQAAADRLEGIRAALDTARESWGETGEATLETGQSFVAGEPVQIFVRKRGRRYDLDDRGRATQLAGKPNGWLPVAERVVAEEGFNVNRAGVVFVPAVEGRDLALLAMRLADMSRAVFAELLELPGATRP